MSVAGVSWKKGWPRGMCGSISRIRALSAQIIIKINEGFFLTYFSSWTLTKAEFILSFIVRPEHPFVLACGRTCFSIAVLIKQHCLDREFSKGPRW